MGCIWSVIYRVFNFISQRRTDNEDTVYFDHSIQIYNVLEYIGASEEVRKVYKDTSMSREITATILNKNFLRRNISEYIFGSTSEGTSTYGLYSDIDQLFSLDCVSLSETILPNIKHSQLLIIRDDHTKPGYVKLHHVLNEIPLMSGMKRLSIIESIDSVGRVVINHFSTVGGLEFLTERCGPADTKTERGINRGGDFVSAFRCKTIPSFANSWLQRFHTYDWPTIQEMELMETYGCFVVGIGHPLSTERDLEWRISFSLQERELMFSLNSTQHKCYILLKMIKKCVLETKIGKSISSYHCKTALFHTIENTPQRYWVPENILYCAQLCLHRILTWLKKEDCPNFFVLEENMFERLSCEQMKAAADTVENILSQGCSKIVRSLKLDHISRRVELCEQNVDLNQVRSDEASKLILISLCDREKNYHYVVKTILQSLDKKDLNDLVPCFHKLYKILKIEEEHKKVDVKESIRGVKSRLHLYLAKFIAGLLVKTTDRCLSLTRRAAFELHIQETGCFDLLSASLVRATLLFRSGNTTACETVLKEFEESFVWSYCGCDYMVTYINPVTHDDVLRKRLKLEDVTKLHTTSCLLLHPSDYDIVPGVLAFEIQLAISKDKYTGGQIASNLIAVDTKVYFYYLKYLIYDKWSKHQEMVFWAEQLRFCLATDPNLGHREIGYNILSWVFIGLDEPLLAFGSLLYSWWTKPNDSVLWLAVLVIFKTKQQMSCIMSSSDS